MLQRCWGKTGNPVDLREQAALVCSVNRHLATQQNSLECGLDLWVDFCLTLLTFSSFIILC